MPRDAIRRDPCSDLSSSLRFFMVLTTVETKRALILPEQESELRADDENRTRTICLEGRGSTIELHPRAVSATNITITQICLWCKVKAVLARNSPSSSCRCTIFSRSHLKDGVDHSFRSQHPLRLEPTLNTDHATPGPYRTSRNSRTRK